MDPSGRPGCEGPDRKESPTRVGQDKRPWRSAVAGTVLATEATREPPALSIPLPLRFRGRNGGERRCGSQGGVRKCLNCSGIGTHDFSRRPSGAGLDRPWAVRLGHRTPAVIRKKFDAGQGWLGQVAYHAH